MFSSTSKIIGALSICSAKSVSISQRPISILDKSINFPWSVESAIISSFSTLTELNIGHISELPIKLTVIAWVSFGKLTPLS